ncbi:adenine nucleotide alpha hydrolase family protein [Myroides sp. LJL119]
MNKIAITLDLSQIDASLIKYAFDYQKVNSVCEIHFIHNLIPSDLQHIWEDYMEELDIEALLINKIKQSIEPYFKDSKKVYIHLTQEEQSEAAIQQVCLSNNISIVFCGWKTLENGSGAMAQKLLRIFKATYFFVPINFKYNNSNILIASDLSWPLKGLVTTLKDTNIISVNSTTTLIRAFNIPALFFPMVKDDKLEQKTAKHLNKLFSDLVKKNPVLEKIDFQPIFQDSKKIVEILQNQCKIKKADMLCLAAKGDSKLRSILIGSLTNKILNAQPFTSLVIVQKTL